MPVTRLVAVIMYVALQSALFGCVSGGNDAQETASSESPTEGGGEKDAATQERPSRANPEKDYFSEHDAGAFYTEADVPRRGSYLQLDLSGLDSEALNRVVHRLRTEFCNCGCVDDTIDECLVIDPDCETARHLAALIIREEAFR